MSKASGNTSENSGIPACSQAMRKLMELLVLGHFKAGESVREANLAQEMGINRAAVREALNQLVSIDVMEYIPYCGYKLLPYTLREMLEWNELRLAIEPLAVRLSDLQPRDFHYVKLTEMQRILDDEERCLKNGDRDSFWHYDIAFHLTLVESSGNRRMSSVFLRGALPTLAAINNKLPKLGDEVQLDNNKMVDVRVTDEQCHKIHCDILNTIILGDINDAAKKLEVHINCICKGIRAKLMQLALSQLPETGQLSDVNFKAIRDKLLDVGRRK